MNENKKVPVLSKLAYGSGAAGGNVVSTILAAFLLSYYTDSAKMGMAAIGTMFLVCRILDGVTDVIMGGIVDKTNTRFGKARPWLLVAAPALAVGLYLILNVPSGFSEGGKMVYAYFTYIFLNCIAFTIFGIAHASLLARMTLDYNDRTNTSVVSSICNNLSGIVVGTITTGMVMKLGWRTTSMILAAACFILVMIAFLGVKEKVGIDETTGRVKTKEAPFREALPLVLKNRYFYSILFIGIFVLLMNANAIASTIYYCNNVIGDPMFMGTLMSIGQIPGVLILFIMPSLSRKFGRREFMAGGCMALIIGFAILGLAGQNRTLVLVGTVLRSIGAGPIFAGIFAFIADITDYGEWKYGVRTEGLISAAQSVGSKVGIGLGSGMTSWILAAGGYVGGSKVQSASAIAAIRFDFGWLGMILSVLLLIAVIMMDVEKYMPEVKEALNKKHQAE